jgi:hypothetical protein
MDDRVRADEIVASMLRLLGDSVTCVLKGTIASVTGRVATVTLADGETTIEARGADHVTLTAGRACIMLTWGRDVLVMATVAP